MCPTLCDPMDCSPPGSSVHRIFQARILEWVAISSSRGSSPPEDRTQLSHIAMDSLPAEPQGKLLFSNTPCRRHKINMKSSWTRFIHSERFDHTRSEELDSSWREHHLDVMSSLISLPVSAHPLWGHFCHMDPRVTPLITHTHSWSPKASILIWEFYLRIYRCYYKSTPKRLGLFVSSSWVVRTSLPVALPANSAPPTWVYSPSQQWVRR